jgi:hypothetical protein
MEEDAEFCERLADAVGLEFQLPEENPATMGRCCTHCTPISVGNERRVTK